MEEKIVGVMLADDVLGTPFGVDDDEDSDEDLDEVEEEVEEEDEEEVEEEVEEEDKGAAAAAIAVRKAGAARVEAEDTKDARTLSHTHIYIHVEAEEASTLFPLYTNLSTFSL